MHYLTAVQWNKDIIRARDCEDHPKVRSTSYMEVYNLIGTSGCSNEEPYWNWEVLGVIETPNGKLVVNPGTWIIEHHSMLLGIVKTGKLKYLEQFLPIERIRYDDINLLDISKNIDVNKLNAVKLSMIDALEQMVHEAVTNPVIDPHLKTDDRLINNRKDN